LLNSGKLGSYWNQLIFFNDLMMAENYLILWELARLLPTVHFYEGSP